MNMNLGINVNTESMVMQRRPDGLNKAPKHYTKPQQTIQSPEKTLQSPKTLDITLNKNMQNPKILDKNQQY